MPSSRSAALTLSPDTGKSEQMRTYLSSEDSKVSTRRQPRASIRRNVKTGGQGKGTTEFNGLLSFGLAPAPRNMRIDGVRCRSATRKNLFTLSRDNIVESKSSAERRLSQRQAAVGRA